MFGLYVLSMKRNPLLSVKHVLLLLIDVSNVIFGQKKKNRYLKREIKGMLSVEFIQRRKRRKKNKTHTQTKKQKKGEGEI